MAERPIIGYIRKSYTSVRKDVHAATKDGTIIKRSDKSANPDGSFTFINKELPGSDFCKSKKQTGFFSREMKSGNVTCFTLIRPQDTKPKQLEPEVVVAGPYSDKAPGEVVRHGTSD